MTLRLLVEALVKYLAGVVMVAAMIFLPAGSLSYWQGWLLMGVLFVPIFVVGVVMMFRSPELLAKRLRAKEGDSRQSRVVRLSGLLFVANFLLAGLNWRYQWLLIADWVVWLAALIFVLCYILYAEVLRENAYLSRTIEVQSGQKVVDTGLYAVVRHPMYTATTLLFLAMPLVLASPLSFVVMLLYLPLIIQRIRHEEALLERELEGYSDYMRRVRYRLLPFIY
ncbi:MAG: isoprenylcysteine carboxylmethyltransferase family protein [Alistipes sp.]|nr:isoprenylcysteine carboxylmethyltransferase family protein [Alistipes sp.]